MTEIAVERRAGLEASSDATILVAGIRLREIDMLALLYPLCRWWAEVKHRRTHWWLSYL